MEIRTGPFFISSFRGWVVLDCWVGKTLSFPTGLPGSMRLSLEDMIGPGLSPGSI